MISSPSHQKERSLSKHFFHISSVYDSLGWCSLTLMKPKIILQRLWEDGLDWDDPVSRAIHETWERWCGELPILCGHLISRREVDAASMQLHEFCDASELACTVVVYLRAVDQDGLVHVSLIMAKTRWPQLSASPCRGQSCVER